MIELQTKKYTPNDKEKILELLKYLWIDLDYQERKDHFEWRYEQNPYLKEPVIMLAYLENNLIGFRAYIAQHFNLKSKTYLVFSPADTIVHPDYRRKGIISKLNEICVAKIQNSEEDKRIIFLNSSTSEDAMPLYLKQKWQKSYQLKSFYLKISLLRFFKRSTTNNITIRANKQKLFDIELSNTIHFEEISVFVEKHRNHEVWTNIRDIDYYKWRYCYKMEDYIFLYCRRQQNLEGYIIVKKLTKNQYSLEEYHSINPKIFKILIRFLTERIHIPVLRSWAFIDDDKNMIKSSGFYIEPSFFLKLLGKKRFPFLVKPSKDNPEDVEFIIDALDIRETKNWQIHLSDMH